METKKKFLENVLIDFYQENSKELLNHEEVLSLANKIFTTSDFSGNNKINTIELCNREKIIFAFPEGLAFTSDMFYVFNIALGSTRIQSFPIEDFLHLEANHRTMFPPSFGRMCIRNLEVKKESNNIFKIEL